jgi:hypothetical protein
VLSASAATARGRWLGRVALFVAGGAAGAALHAALVRAPTSQLVSIVRGPQLAAQPAGAAPGGQLSSAASSGPTAVPPLAVAMPSAPPSAAPVSAAGTPHAGIARLDAERALLDAARTSLIGGDHETALRVLERHERTYHRPLLGDERDALFVQALVRAGRYDEARTRAEALRRRSPNSLFLSAVDAALSTIP